MSPRAKSFSTTVRRQILVDICRTVGGLLLGLWSIFVLSLWHRLVSGAESEGAITATSTNESPVSGAAVVEYELSWYRYIKAFDAHHGPGGTSERDIQSGSFLRGLRVWAGKRFLRGYTLADEVYVCPNAPRVLRVHQAGHTPSFGKEFFTLVRSRRKNGGLEDEPLRTLDVMLPGDFPHTFLRLRDSRNLRDAYEQWLQDGRIVRFTPDYT